MRNCPYRDTGPRVALDSDRDRTQMQRGKPVVSTQPTWHAEAPQTVLAAGARVPGDRRASRRAWRKPAARAAASLGLLLFTRQFRSPLIYLLLAAGAVLLGLPRPLSAVQMLWANIVTEGVQDVTLALGRGDGGELGQAPRRRGARLVDRRALLHMVPAALVMAGVALWPLDDAVRCGATHEEACNGVLLCVVLFQNVLCAACAVSRSPNPSRATPGAVATFLVSEATESLLARRSDSASID